MKTDTVQSRTDYFAIRNPIARFRIGVANAFERNPLWRFLNRLCMPIALPFRWFANYSLAKLPALERLEWLLEIRSLANRAPALILLSATLCVIRGFRVTQFGHIGTDRTIYPLIGLISSFNPFLAICCAILFGVADLVQKLFFVNDIYGAPDRFSLQFAGALMGYMIAYSALVVMGLAPGIASRLTRRGIARILSRVGSADGASEKKHIPSVTEDIFAIAASTATAVLTMRNLVPDIEKPAFYLRPEADGTCYQLEVGELRATAPFAGLGAALGNGLLERPEGELKLNQLYDENGNPIPVSDQMSDRPEGELKLNEVLPANENPNDKGSPIDDVQAVVKAANDEAGGVKSLFDVAEAITNKAKSEDSVWTAAGVVAADVYSDLVKSDVLTVLENQTGSLVDVAGAVVSAWDEYEHSDAQSLAAKILDATGAAEISIVVGADPVTAIPDAAMNLLGDAGIVAGADKNSISGTLNGLVDVITTDTDALLTDNVDELMKLQQNLQDGKRGKLLEWAAGAGPYWGEHGLVDGLAQGDEGAEIAIRDLERDAIDYVDNVSSPSIPSNGSSENQ